MMFNLLNNQHTDFISLQLSSCQCSRPSLGLIKSFISNSLVFSYLNVLAFETLLVRTAWSEQRPPDVPGLLTSYPKLVSLSEGGNQV